MKTIRPLPPVEIIREWFDYNAGTGVFRWRKSPNRQIPIGSVAGCLDKRSGYYRLELHGRVLRAHRVAWLYVHGVDPVAQIDHKDGNRTNNVIANLREATGSQQIQNQRVRKNTKSGLKGVSWHTGDKRWRAQIYVSGKSKFLGTYRDPRDAHAAYAKAALEHFGEFARTSHFPIRCTAPSRDAAIGADTGFSPGVGAAPHSNEVA